MQENCSGAAPLLEETHLSNGYPISFYGVSDYHSSALFSDLISHSKGIKRLAVLRGDVDNMGQAFIRI